MPLVKKVALKSLKGNGHLTLNRKSLYNLVQYVNPSYWVDDHPLLIILETIGSLDPITHCDISLASLKSTSPCVTRIIYLTSSVSHCPSPSTIFFSMRPSRVFSNHDGFARLHP